jgi:hypothetical protein
VVVLKPVASAPQEADEQARMEPAHGEA